MKHRAGLAPLLRSVAAFVAFPAHTRRNRFISPRTAAKRFRSYTPCARLASVWTAWLAMAATEFRRRELPGSPRPQPCPPDPLPKGFKTATRRQTAKYLFPVWSAVRLRLCHILRLRSSRPDNRSGARSSKKRRSSSPEPSYFHAAPWSRTFGAL
jgi:hypothetical protein